MHRHDTGCFMHTFPLFRSMRWYAYHACLCPHWLCLHLYTLAYMFMHESCLLVCRPCFNTMKSWTFGLNLHLSLADTICSLVCAPLLLVCLLSSLFTYSFVCLNPGCCACRIYLACSLYVLLLLSTHFASITYLLVFLSLPFHVHTWSEDTWG